MAMLGSGAVVAGALLYTGTHLFNSRTCVAEPRSGFASDASGAGTTGRWYDLSAVDIDGKPVTFDRFAGKVWLFPFTVL